MADIIFISAMYNGLIALSMIEINILNDSDGRLAVMNI